jgi:BlaR1 peptidase M56
VILLPVAALANLTPSQVEAILAHELVHIRRHDYVVNVLETLAEILLFYHPCVWWVSERIRLEREHCCDDVVVDVCGDAVDYATALAELEAWRSQGTSVALAATGGSLADRLRRVLGTPAGHEPRSLSWVLTLGLTILIVIGVGRHLPLFDPNPAAAVSSTQRTEPIASPDTFDWQVFRTDHFDVHYYPAGEQDLERVETAAKRAYQWVTSELTYYLPFRVPLVLFECSIESRHGCPHRRCWADYRESSMSEGRAGTVHGGDRLPWVETVLNGVDEGNFAPLTSLDWHVHVYGDAAPEIEAMCDERKLPLHVFPWRLEIYRTGLQRDAVYLVRPDGSVALADPHPSATAVTSYLDARKLIPGRYKA